MPNKKPPKDERLDNQNVSLTFNEVKDLRDSMAEMANSLFDFRSAYYPNDWQTREILLAALKIEEAVAHLDVVLMILDGWGEDNV